MDVFASGREILLAVRATLSSSTLATTEPPNYTLPPVEVTERERRLLELSLSIELEKETPPDPEEITKSSASSTSGPDKITDPEEEDETIFEY